MLSQQNTLIVNPGKTAKFLLYILFLLIIAHTTGLVLKYVFDHGMAFGLVPLFDFNTEQNIPTLFSTILLIISSFCLFLLYRAQRMYLLSGWRWVLLSIIFVFLAIDEFSELHEKLSKPVHEQLNTGGLLYYAWVIPYGIAVIALAVIYLPAWWKMPKRIRSLIALAAILYLTGSIGMEMVGSRHFEATGDKLDLWCGIYAGIEESLEIGGLILLIYSILYWLKMDYGGFSILLFPFKNDVS
jgi:hypothetical protein